MLNFENFDKVLFFLVQYLNILLEHFQYRSIITLSWIFFSIIIKNYKFINNTYNFLSPNVDSAYLNQILFRVYFSLYTFWCLNVNNYNIFRLIFLITTVLSWSIECHITIYLSTIILHIIYLILQFLFFFVTLFFIYCNLFAAT